MSFAALCAGGAAWTVSEYLIHRFIGHGKKRSMPPTLLGRISPAGLAYEFNREHLAHHANPSYFAPTYRKVLAAAVAVPAVAAVATPLVGPRRALAFAAGFASVYAGYEVVHRFIHVRPPRGPYSRWARRHHLLHHHKTPRNNHGVTSPVWDLVFRTYDPVERVRVPRHVAPTWMVGADGDVKPEYADDYEIVGKPRPGAAPSMTAQA
ncbi:MAG: sterol desaturase family protein [Myxococcales bacterium]|nr:sterol desaturase family protein [Myxococcales bacterium]